MNKDSLIYLAGHTGMVGSALMEELVLQGFTNILTVPFEKLDLRNQRETNDFIQQHKPEYVFLIAGKVGGIQANIQYPAEFLYDNLSISANVIHASHLAGVKKLLFLGSSCIYPRLCPQPMKEEYLLTGSLEPTNEAYAIGKIAGLKLCQYYNQQYNRNFIAAIPPNLYGEGDNFDPSGSHVVSALIRKIHAAKIQNMPQVEMWGTGKARREFLYVKDLVKGLVFLMQHYNQNQAINIGSGNDVSILELAEIVKKVVRFSGTFQWDASKPDGMPQKLMDSGLIHKLGWHAKTTLESGLENTYNWYLSKL